MYLQRHRVRESAAPKVKKKTRRYRLVLFVFRLEGETTLSDTPETLLKSALEKIVYFEARSSQLSNDLSSSRSEVERLKADLGSAAQREIELRRVVAELEVRATRAHSEREDAARVIEALRRERAELIGKMLEASRIHRTGSGHEVEDFDLSQFIAELRSEVILKRENAAAAVVPARVAAAAEPSTFEQQPHGVTAVGSELRSQGRLTVSAAQMAELGGAHAFQGRSEETLFGFSVRELSAIDVQARVRAAERLKALAHPAAAPALATALNSETEPAALVAFLGAISGLAHGEAVPVVQPHLASSSPDVRIAALKALLVLDATHAGPHLAAAMKDPDSAVRRRASLLALGLTGSSALALGEQAIRDPVADVRSLAALVLGASGAESARGVLLDAMRDSDMRVRRSASQAMSRLLGRDVTGLVSLEASQRRREVRRLVNEPARPVMPAPRPVARVAPPRVPAQVAVLEAVETLEVAVASPCQPQKLTQVINASARVAVLEVETEQAAGLLSSVLRELRASIRGCPVDQLMAGVNASQPQTLNALSTLLAQGQVVRRGHKYFVA